jgi:nucleoside-diphosphate-sugar epimerase
LARTPGRAVHLTRQGVSLIEGDLDDSGALHRLVSDAAAVIHAAGAVRGSSQQDFDHINVSGTRNVLDAINAQPTPPRLLLLSSLAAREPSLSWYAASKRAGESLLDSQPALDWLILRPPAVYGPGDKEMLPVFQAMARGIAPVPGDTKARISLIHVSDLVAAVIACLQCDATRHRTLTLCDGKPNGYDWREMADLVAAVWGRKVRLWQVPRWLLDSLAWANVRSAGLTGRSPMLTPAKLRELRHSNWVTDNELITASTGWEPAIGLRPGLEQLHKAEL